MPQSSGKIETIAIVPDDELSSAYQIDLPSLNRALSRKPTYKVYKTLLVHHRTLKCLNSNVDLRVQKADAALNKASENLRNTAVTLANACNSTASANPATRPSIVGEVLQGIVELQTFYQREKVSVLLRCRWDQIQAQKFLQETSKRVKKVEQTLVKKYGIHTVDDEGNPLLNEHNVERIIDLMASVPGIETS